MKQGFDQSLVVASYNIRAGLGTDLRRDPARSMAQIKALEADIVALQEADFRLGHRPSALPRDRIETETGLRPVHIGGHPESLGWHGIALLVKAGIVETDVDAIDLPGLEPRGALLADLDTPIGPLRIAAVHLGLLRYARRRQLTHLRQALADMPGRPTLIIGDFNEWSVKKGLGRIARDYSILTPGRTFPSRRPMLALDRIAHSDDLSLTALNPLRQGLRTHPSDHLPISARVRIRDEANA